MNWLNKRLPTKRPVFHSVRLCYHSWNRLFIVNGGPNPQAHMYGRLKVPTVMGPAWPIFGALLYKEEPAKNTPLKMLTCAFALLCALMLLLVCALSNTHIRTALYFVKKGHMPYLFFTLYSLHLFDLAITFNSYNYFFS